MLADALAIAGGVAITVGVCLVSIPAACVVGGALLILGAWRLS